MNIWMDNTQCTHDCIRMLIKAHALFYRLGYGLACLLLLLLQQQQQQTHEHTTEVLGRLGTPPKVGDIRV